MPTLHALLLTDVVDSTRLTEELGDAAMAALWTAHDRIARDLLPAWRGREIDKTDGMLLLFDDVSDAVGYALAYHRALAARELPFKARAGIHVGPISLRPNTADDVARGAKPVEVDGLALPIAARVMSVALGAQTLLSADARLALGVAPHRVVSHGHWRMHGVADPVELFEVGEAGDGSGAPFKAPPDSAKVYRVMRQGDLWQPVREVRHSVPAERDSFVGRQEPLQLLASKFDNGARLVSVLGMGGTGKTRLVTRFAWTVLGDYPGGVWFCDLSQARTVDGIHFAVAQGLDVPLGKSDAVVQLAHAIAGRGRCLVILDNFEQVARFAEETLGRWLERAPQAQFIVTTREVLGIVGEELLALAPLLGGEAIDLFQRRARAASAQPRSIEPGELAALEKLVKMLDGLPLAIELAAARASVMGPSELLSRMHQRFELLRSRSGRHDRQATLRNTFHWSWELLTDVERAAFAQLSVFDGGFSITSAQAVLDLTALAPQAPAIIDAVQSLTEKSLVRPVARDRFDMLDSLRDYAAEQLATENPALQTGTAAQRAAYRRHGEFFARECATSALDADNFVSAFGRAVERGDIDTALGCLKNAWDVFSICGPPGMGFDMVARAHGLRNLSKRQVSELERTSGSVLMFLGRMEDARRAIYLSLDEARSLADPKVEARALGALASLELRMGNLRQSQEIYTQVLDMIQEGSDLSFASDIFTGLAASHEYRGDVATALPLWRKALKAACDAGDVGREGRARGNLGSALASIGEAEEATKQFQMALKIAGTLRDRRSEGTVSCNLGIALHDWGQSIEALPLLDTALVAAKEIGHPRLEALAHCNLGIVHEALGRLDLALAHCSASVRIAHELDDRRSEGQFLGHLGLMHARGANFEVSSAYFAQGVRLLREVDDATSLVVLLCAAAEARQLGGDDAAAHLALDEAIAISRRLGSEPSSDLGRALRRVTTLMKSDHLSAQ